MGGGAKRDRAAPAPLTAEFAGRLIARVILPPGMESTLQLVHAAEPIPASFSAAVYLGGPAGRSGWRRQAVDLLQAAGYQGVVYLPEPRDGRRRIPPERLSGWTAAAQHHADAILFFVPPEHGGDALAFEDWGRWQRSGKAVFGAPHGAPVNVHRVAAARLRVPSGYSLAEVIHLGLPLLVPGAVRSGGERAVPLYLWRSPAFQRWYRGQLLAGNHLEDIEVEWTYRPRGGAGRAPLVYVLRPRVWVKAERRYKSGEVVVGRSDVSATVLYRPAETLRQTQVVVVREFRSAVHNAEGMVWSLPGGSAENAAERDTDPRVTAAREVHEETGLQLEPGELEPVPHGVRQVAATLLSHRSHLYRARLTDEQLERLRESERRGTCFGANPGERCYVAVKSVAQMMDGEVLDWGQVGMLLAALAPDLR